MSWAVGFDYRWGRDVGYGVPAVCDQPGCDEQIDRGLSYVCGGESYGDEDGCGLYFCGHHLKLRFPRGCGGFGVENCYRCRNYKRPYKAKPDVREWVEWKLTDESWQQWRDENRDEVERLRIRQSA